MSTREPRAVAVTLLKGGIGKSTTATNTARELAHRGHETLLIDLDPNGHATTSLGLDDAFGADTHLGDVLIEETHEASELIRSTEYGIDVLPSNDEIESVEDDLGGVMMGTARLKNNVVDPLLGETYDYVVIDCPAARGKLNDNALYAAQNMILPLRPDSGALSGLDKTIERLIQPARDHFELEILAVAPTDLSDRIDQDRSTRKLIEPLVRSENIRPRVPNFAYVEPEFFDAVDEGEWDEPLPKPGIRHRAAIDNAIREGMPVRDYDDTCDQLACYEELAAIVERGEVIRDE